ncbi:hypothetical protein ABGT15_04235 [Flavobacterium enshiense]|uniref:hypothetical protein n=1 Tax=Flavobacterium enshiense TaxID=1341165 RepID=UPI00345D29DA
MINENENTYIYNIDLNNYVLPEIKCYVGNKYVLNGEKNSFFEFVKKRYIGSKTNSLIINKLVNYIIGDGLVDKSGINVNKYISKRDLRLIVQDFKIYGQYTVQVIWSKGSKLLNEQPKPIQIKHVPTGKVGLDVNRLGEISGYWHSFDWSNFYKYKPKFYNKFTGIYNENSPIDFKTVTRISSEPYFPQPDYLSGLQYAWLEEELSNKYLNYVLNDLSVGCMIVAKGGIPATEEQRREYSEKFLQAITGTSNNKKPFVYFTNNENDLEIKRIEISEFDQQAAYLDEVAKDSLFDAHGIGNRTIFGKDSKTGFSSTADEMDTTLKHLYIDTIKPMREIIIDGLEEILRFAEPTIELDFINSKELISIKNDTNE